MPRTSATSSTDWGLTFNKPHLSLLREGLDVLCLQGMLEEGHPLYDPVAFAAVKAGAPEPQKPDPFGLGGPERNVLRSGGPAANVDRGRSTLGLREANVEWGRSIFALAVPNIERGHSTFELWTFDARVANRGCRTGAGKLRA